MQSCIHKKKKKKNARKRHKPPLLHDKSKGAVNVTTQQINQLANVAILPASPFILTGRIYNITKKQ